MLFCGRKSRNGELVGWCTEKLATTTEYQHRPLQIQYSIAAPYGRVVPAVLYMTTSFY